MKKGCSPFRGDNFADYLEPRIKRCEAGYTTPCWLWQQTTCRKGYARWRVPKQFGKGSKTVALHRVSYEQLVGPIPDGLVIDHLCRNRACLNPEHLEPVTALENTKRGVGNQWADVTHCKHGHLFDEENTIIRSDGRRRCRICQRARIAERRARIRLELNQKCSACCALLNETNTSGYCARCVNTRLASDCEDARLRAKIVQLPIVGKVAA